MALHPLDNPVWSALTTAHASLARGGTLAKRYPEEIEPIAALAQPGRAAWTELAGLVGPGDHVYMAAQDLDATLKALPDSLAVRERATLIQMVCTQAISHTAVDAGIVTLTDDDVPEMMALVELTQPGPFRRLTHTLGTFVGIRHKGRLVAMAGMRFMLEGYREVSAVCTHPDHVGRGLARVLVTRVANAIHTEGRTPFLHVVSENVRARELYARIGFAERAALPMAVVGRAG
jgi:predicted GNAT family acetyltransferase